jgi:ribonuclease VapC
MIVVDASAVIAMIAKEPAHESVTARLAANTDRFISPVSYVEVVMALTRSMPDGKLTADAYMSATNISVLPIDAEQTQWATHAHAFYGKGRHAARLNLGDCFSYAAAKALNAPLLYVGDDFGKTDIRAA